MSKLNRYFKIIMKVDTFDQIYYAKLIMEKTSKKLSYGITLKQTLKL